LAKNSSFSKMPIEEPVPHAPHVATLLLPTNTKIKLNEEQKIN
jgi:hypothetical protein